MDASRKRVVIVGAGFGGLEAAKRLAGAPVSVVVIDRTNHHLFQPLLYQVATAALEPADIATPIRAILKRHQNVEVLMGEVTGADPVRRTISVAEVGDIGYDFLILASGSSDSWFGHPDWARNSWPLKTLDDAAALRSRLLAAFEYAESAADPAETQHLLTFVVVGGGPTGVELAGAIRELARFTLARDFRHIHPADARVVLFEAGPRLLAGFSQALSAYAERKLRDLGVEVRTGTGVDVVDTAGVTFGGERLRAANVFWCAGVAATPAAAWLGIAPARHGAVAVEPDCSVSGHPEVFAIGDVASFAGSGGRPLPGLAPVAKQQGRYVARLILSRVAGAKSPGPFVYRDAGALAMIGRSAAVADIRGFHLTGIVAWLLWSAVHLFLLIGFRNRAVVYVNWVWAWLTYGRGARLITGEPADWGGDGCSNGGLKKSRREERR